MTDNIVVVEEINNVVVVQETVPTIVITSPGPQGPQGPMGNVFYTHIQNTPNATWTINHNLVGYPTAVVFDSSGSQCEGTFSYPSNNQMVISFSSAFSGTAYII
jgi:hypothetical protein